MNSARLLARWPLAIASVLGTAGTPGLASSSFSSEPRSIVTVDAAADSGARTSLAFGPDGKPLIAGFVVSAEGAKTLLVRAVGPTLATLSGLALSWAKARSKE